MAEEEVICIGCPLGCLVKLTIDYEGEVVNVSGNECKEGEKYAMEEYKNPVRVLTATVFIESSAQPLLPVKTNRPIPKTMLQETMLQLAKTRVKPPIKMGGVIIPNLLNTGFDIVATSNLPV